MISPTVLNTPHGTQDIPTFIMIPPQYWTPPMVLKISPTVLMISPHGTEHPPQYCTHIIQGENITVNDLINVLSLINASLPWTLSLNLVSTQIVRIASIAENLSAITTIKWTHYCWRCQRSKCPCDRDRWNRIRFYSSYPLSDRNDRERSKRSYGHGHAIVNDQNDRHIYQDLPYLLQLRFISCWFWFRAKKKIVELV